MMAHFAKSEIFITSCNALLVKSTRIYQEISELYQSMQNELSNTSALKAHATVKTLNSLLEYGRTIDNLIDEQLKSLQSLTESTKDLLAKRDDLLNRLYSDNKNIVSRAESVKSLLRHEITTMSTNRNAIKGYKPVDTGRKSIVRNFF